MTNFPGFTSTVDSYILEKVLHFCQLAFLRMVTFAISQLHYGASCVISSAVYPKELFKKILEMEQWKCIERKTQGLHILYEESILHSCLLPSLGAKSQTATFKRHFAVHIQSFFVFLLLPNKAEKRIVETYVGWQLHNSSTSSFLLFPRRQSVKTKKLPLPPQKLLNNGFSRSNCTSLTRPFPQMGCAI